MSADRVIPARRVDYGQVEAFPYFAAQFSAPVNEADDEDDRPLAAGLSTPEEDAHRLASVDQQIFDKLQQAERDSQDTARRGYEEGFAAGETEGRQFGESQYRAHLQRLEGHLQELSDSLALNRVAAQDEILALALALGEYLAGRQIEGGGASIAPLLASILEARPFPVGAGDSPEATALTVHLNPKDLEELPAVPGAHPGVTVKEDPELSRGGLRIEAAVGVLDASVERRKAKLAELIQTFREKEAQ